MQKVLQGRRTLIGATLLAATGLRQAAAEGAPDRLRILPEPRALPEGLGFTDVEGKATAFNDFRGKALLVNFWATWCAPCVAEMPSLDRLQAAMAAEGLVVLALSSDRGGKAQVEPFFRRTGLQKLGMWLDPRGATGRALGVRVLPTSLLIDRNGMEVARAEGDLGWDTPAVIATIRRLTSDPTTRSQDRT